MLAYQLEKGGKPLLDAVRENCEKGATTDIKAPVPSVWVKVSMLDNCACVI